MLVPTKVPFTLLFIPTGTGLVLEDVCLGVLFVWLVCFVLGFFCFFVWKWEAGSWGLSVVAVVIEAVEYRFCSQHTRDRDPVSHASLKVKRAGSRVKESWCS